MAWRLAQSLETLRSELNATYPLRDTAADGTIGDQAHQNQGSASDHNPWVIDSNGTPVVRAFDITSDPAIDPAGLAERLRALGDAGDPRLLHFGYVIYNGRIAGYSDGPDSARWQWRSYDGDPHTSHIHLSVSREQSGYDATNPWPITTEEPVTDAQMKELLDAIHALGALLEGSRDSHGNDTDPTHESLRDVSAKLDKLIVKLGA